MVFIRYFFKRYFCYVGAIALLLTVLLTLIELFEKLMRVSHTSLAHIGIFLGLNSAPLFFDNCGVASWLATGLLLREFFVHHEWELMMMLNISNKELLRLFALAGCLLLGTVIISKELFVSSLAFKAEKFKIKHFKQKMPQLLVHRWVQLQEHKFCYIGSLDMETRHGQDMIVLSMSPDFSIEQALIINQFSADHELEQVVVERGSRFGTSSHQCISMGQEIVKVPELFSQLMFDFQAPTAWHYYTSLMQTGKQLPSTVFNKLLHQLLKKLSSYTQILLYSLLTALLFIIWYAHERFRWFALLIAYPLFLSIDVLLDFLVSFGFSAWIVLAPYCLLALLIILIRIFLLK